MAGQVTGDESLEELMDLVAKLQKNVDWLMDGNLSSKNVREIGGFNVSQTMFRSREGDVGLSSANDAADPVRLWAGSTNKDTAPWRVYKSGKSVMTGALIQSKNGYPKIVMDPDNDLFGAYTSPSKYINILAMDGSYSSPALHFRDQTIPMYGLMYIDPVYRQFQIMSAGDMIITAGTSLLTLGGYRVKTDWSTFYNYAETQTLQQALDSKASTSALAGKANSGVSTGLSGGHNHGINPGEFIQIYNASGNPTRLHSWSAAPQHSHAQV